MAAVNDPDTVPVWQGRTRMIEPRRLPRSAHVTEGGRVLLDEPILELSPVHSDWKKLQSAPNVAGVMRTMPASASLTATSGKPMVMKAL